MKRAMAILLALVMVLALVACTPQGTTTTTQQGTTTTQQGSTQQQTTGGELAGTYNITVWCADAIVDLTKKQIEDFNATNTDGIVINATVEAVGEGDAATQMITDVEAGGDLFCFAQDQFNRLVQAGALGKLGVAASDMVKTNNDPDSVTAVTLGEDLYAYPLTADNGYFMYYDKSVIPEEDIGSLEKLVADCEAAGKYFSMETDTSAWYIASFFFGTGCVSEWNTDDDGNFISIHDTFNSPEGLIAAKGMKKLVDSPMYLSSSDAAGFSSNCAIVVTGTWGYNTAAAALGDNLGAAELPSFEVDGKTYHMGSFNGFKLLGVKPQTDAVKNAVLHKLAQYLAGEQGQLERFQTAAWGPSNLVDLQNAEVLAHPAVAAVMAQKAYATPQGQIHGSWWDIAKVIGTDVENATDEAGLQAALDNYTAAISAVFQMSDDEKNAFAVIGSICGSNWDKDFPMTEKETGVWVSGELELKAGDEFKVRQGRSWDVNYGEDCAPNGANIVVPADDIYTVTLDLNAMTLTFVNQEGVLPEAAPAPEGEEAPDTWGVVGSFEASGWNEDVAMTEKEAGVWVSAPVELKAGDEFKVRANGEWKKDFGVTDGETVAGGNNVVVEADGVYIVTLDLNTPSLTFAEKEPDVWAVIGSICGTAWDTDFAMTEVEAGVWKSEPLELKAGEEFKVRANADWDLNYGLDDGVATPGGSNVKVEADGTYVVTLDLNALTLVYAEE